MNVINEKLQLIIERLNDDLPDIRKNALEMLFDEVRSTLGTITSEQQDLFDVINILKKYLSNFKDSERQMLNDIISVLSMGSDNESIRNVILYRLDGNITSLEYWGHQYVRQLIFGCCMIRNKEIEAINYLSLIDPIVAYLFKYNCEIEAIDFLLEISGLPEEEICGNNIRPENGTNINKLELIAQYTDNNNFYRIYLYLLELNKFFDLYKLILKITKQFPSMYLVHLIEFELYQEAIDYVKTQTGTVRLQLLYILAKCNIYFQTGISEEEAILTNSHISNYFVETATNLEILQSKKIDYILKGLNIDKVDIAVIANGLIHYGFMRDPIFRRFSGDYNIKSEYLNLLNQCNNKIVTINASMGCIYGFNHVELAKLFTNDLFEVKDLGTILGYAIAGAKSHDRDGSMFQLLSGFLNSTNTKDILIALTGISIVYSGSIGCEFSIIYEKIFPLLNHSNTDVICMSIYTLCSVFYGTARNDLVSICTEIFVEQDLSTSEFYTFAILGIGLLFYKRVDLFDSEEYTGLPKPIQILALGLMHLGSGSPDIVEEIMNNCFAGETEPLNESLGLISIVLVGIGDSLASQMIENQLMSSLLLNNIHIKNVVPSCLALLYASSMKSDIIDFLERSMSTRETNVTSIVALGILAAGTNNSRAMSILSSNFNAMYKDIKASNALIFSQGLINLGKGMLTLSPLVYDKRIIIDKSIIGLLGLITMLLNENYSCFKENSFILYIITQAILPKYVTGITGEIKVGKPVETVGLTGNPNRISGKIVYTSPIILNYDQKAETDVEVETVFIEDILIKK
ncbi:19S-PA700 proteasome regulatory particle subunit Rpn1p-S1 [Enterocytozoon bieneusi H348]|nr:19S-PA700 proteasome regulatory particle subunit Rpn1p-S1 [Enterocytozoon bieneusi H348]|eukprot:XP_001827818.1 19S-PA700 proteasome regulatory particle subunit Rpn1p-S1 [Enterocytozoon bieneusi H348]